MSVGGVVCEKSAASARYFIPLRAFLPLQNIHGCQKQPAQPNANGWMDAAQRSRCWFPKFQMPCPAMPCHAVCPSLAPCRSGDSREQLAQARDERCMPTKTISGRPELGPATNQIDKTQAKHSWINRESAIEPMHCEGNKPAHSHNQASMCNQTNKPNSRLISNFLKENHGPALPPLPSRRQ